MNNKIRKSFYLIIMIVILIILIGTLFYKFSENISWMDAFYSTSMLITTAGSGNLSPTQSSTKLFTICFVLFGVPIVLFCFGYLVEQFFKRRIRQIESKMDKIIEREDEIIRDEEKILKEESELLKAKKKN